MFSLSVCLLSLIHTQVVGAIRRPAWAWDYISRPPYAYALLEADIPAESIAAYVNRQKQKHKQRGAGGIPAESIAAYVNRQTHKQHIAKREERPHAHTPSAPSLS